MIIMAGTFIVGCLVLTFVYRKYQSRRNALEAAAAAKREHRRRSVVSPRNATPEPLTRERGNTSADRTSDVLKKEMYMVQQVRRGFLSKMKTKMKIMSSFYQIISQFEYVLVIRMPPIFVRTPTQPNPHTPPSTRTRKMLTPTQPPQPGLARFASLRPAGEVRSVVFFADQLRRSETVLVRLRLPDQFLYEVALVHSWPDICLIVDLLLLLH